LGHDKPVESRAPPTQSTFKGPEKFADIETADAVRRGELDMKHHAVKPCPF
jgi:hypothetical protein